MTTNRGNETRSRLLDVATELFARNGFESVSTREIASAAQTTLPSIAHHFGSKEGDQAVIARMAEQIAERSAPVSAAIVEELDAGSPSRERMVELLQLILGAQLRSLLVGRVGWAALITREQMRDSDALAPVDAVLEQHLFLVVARLVGALRGKPADDTAVKLQAVALIGRALPFQVAQPSVLRYLGWKALTPVEVDVIVTALNAELKLLFA